MDVPSSSVSHRRSNYFHASLHAKLAVILQRYPSAQMQIYRMKFLDLGLTHCLQQG